jgi:hypothetical protein
MTPSDPTPKLPLWIFFLTDAVLVATAAIIHQESARPLSPVATLSIVGCIFAGMIVLFVPLVARYERQKNEALDDRQRALEALARTVSSSAEQISIAVNGLDQIADHVQRNLRHVEQLPHKLQDKIAEFQSQLANANDAEKEELEKELVALRSADSERLDAVSTRVTKAVAELTRLEAATQQHLTAANDALAKLSFGAAGAIGKAQAAAEQAFAHARTEAARGLGEVAGQATRSIDAAKAAALADLDAKLATATDAFVARVSRELASKPIGAIASASVSEHTAKKHREPAAEKPAPTREPEPEPAANTTAAPASEPKSAAPAEEPPPIVAEKIPQVAPVAPQTAEPFARPGETEATVPAAVAAPPTEAAPPKPPRKRAPKKPEPAAAPETPAPAPAAVDHSEPTLALDVDESPTSAPEPAENVLSSDGATRLLVTAYIGIGNRLFIRGAGPGLTWEKGVPLQFVSIGKWRWETNDATGPVQFKLYKNDELECTALGAQTVEPGYQQEVSATF